MLQALCNCGRIAEVRRRKTGKKLRFINCTNCGTQLGSTAVAAEIEKNERENIGVKGDFAPTSKPNSEEAIKTTVSSGKDWVPDSENEPEINSEKSETPIKKNSQMETEEKPTTTPFIIKCLAVVFTVAAFGGGAYQLNKLGNK